MRPTFLSEQQYIRNVLRRHGRTFPHALGPIVSEYYAQPRDTTRHRFNVDFAIDFVPFSALENFSTVGTSVHPTHLGADLFVTVDKDTNRPLRSELMFGEAFPIEYFSECIAVIESTLRTLSCAIQIHDCAYSRIFVVENDICFLALPHHDSPVMHGAKQLLQSDASATIAIGQDDLDLIYIDGWIRTSVADSEWKLVATMEASEHEE